MSALPTLRHKPKSAPLGVSLHPGAEKEATLPAARARTDVTLAGARVASAGFLICAHGQATC